MDTPTIDGAAWLGSALVDTRYEYSRLFDIYVPIAIGVFVIILLVIVLAVLRYRKRPPEQAARWYENDRLEGSYALLLVGIVAFLLYLTYTAEHRVDTVSAQERPAVTIEVTGSKWEWTFYYPSYGITAYSGTVGHAPLVVPVGEAVRFNLVTEDVIHAFWIPALRFKRDLDPGTTETITLDFARPGVFDGQCAEFCGLRHSDMLFTVHALSPAQFASWAAAHRGERAR
ncbi:MAG: cytochrome c oxidase subunit II [Solirubrobacteraceae bacterium]